MQREASHISTTGQPLHSSNILIINTVFRIESVKFDKVTAHIDKLCYRLKYQGLVSYLTETSLLRLQRLFLTPTFTSARALSKGVFASENILQ
jgi:hypothetical protein